MRTLRIYSVNYFSMYHTAMLTVVIIKSLVLNYNWKFVLWTTFLQFPLLPLLMCHNHKSDLFF